MKATVIICIVFFIMAVIVAAWFVAELLKSINDDSEMIKGAPFDEPGCFNPDQIPAECKECGHQNSENCNTCRVLNPQFDGC